MRPRKLRSRGLARPVVTRAKQPLDVVDPAQRLAQVGGTAPGRRPARRRRRAGRGSPPTSVSGLASQSASSREPIAVTVRSSTASSEPSRRPSRMRAGDLQAAAAGLVDLQRAGGAVGQQPVDVRERALLRLGQIIEDRAGGADRLGVGRRRRRSRNPSSPAVPKCLASVCRAGLRREGPGRAGA